MIGVSGSEDVVRDVAAHAVDIVFPLELRGHALDIAEELALGKDLSCRVRCTKSAKSHMYT